MIIESFCRVEWGMKINNQETKRCIIAMQYLVAEIKIQNNLYKFQNKVLRDNKMQKKFSILLTR